MAEIDLFHYRAGRGFLHRYHTGFKLLSMIILTIAIFNGEIMALSFLSLFIFSIFALEYYQSRIMSPLALIKNTKRFLIFLIIIIFTRGLMIDGSALSFFPLLSREGLTSGLLYSWKLLLLIVLGQTFISTTSPVKIHQAIFVILHPLPLINAGNTATMVSLTITFIPLIFDQYREIKDAYESRLGNNALNPVKKIYTLTLPLLQSTLLRVDEVTLAMESRCYSDNPTLPESNITLNDVLGLIICIAIPLIFFLLNCQI